MMSKRRRVTRASPDDIWRHCKQFGDCPDDIQKVYTGNTIADNILKWASSFLFFGGLGIGSAEGAVAAAASEHILPIGGGSLPKQPIDVPITRVPASNVTPGFSDITVNPDVALDAGTVVHAAEPVDPVSGTPPIIHASPNSTEVIPPIRPVENPPWQNPFDSGLETPGVNVGVVDYSAGNEIELSVLSSTAPTLTNAVEETELFSRFELDPRTSTPNTTTRGGWMSHVAVGRFAKTAAREVPLPVLTSTGGVMQFENPAFEFSEAVSEVSRSISFNDPDSAPFARLSRPSLFQRAGRLGVQRVGNLLGMVTRAGKQLFVPRVYYNELSSIFESPDVLEMEPIIIEDSGPPIEDEAIPGAPAGVFPQGNRPYAYNGYLFGPIPVDVSIKVSGTGFIPMPVTVSGNTIFPLYPSFDKSTPLYPPRHVFFSDLDDPIMFKRRKKCFADGCVDAFY
ncbi:L2 capsid protein [Caretta caretta papillomavirus 1]|uniref:L2 capsid protein n=1 Tax=Caretta caretta papillomavirus 1 TaxID=485241 RepID=B6RUQ3_9PAPI|nr:L2 capsid protein [Caretta caretta papillomavirus 1]ACD39817.1 L2 capsid protein [Caretta caretta papillomavirus 1]